MCENNLDLKINLKMSDLASVTRSGDFFNFGQLFKAFGNN